jgi:DNA topoisomerase-3
MGEIKGLVRLLVRENGKPNSAFASLFGGHGPGGAGEQIGTCPRCGKPVCERSRGFFCDDRACGFALWRDNRFFGKKRKELTKAIATALLKDGHVKVKGLYSEKTGKTYDATVILDDDGGKYVNFKLEFEKGGRKDGK